MLVTKYWCVPIYIMAFTKPYHHKKAVLSKIAHLYDPLSLISPVTIRAKMFIQDLWLARVEWDEPLNAELQHRWEVFQQQLSSLSRLNIPRWINILPLTTSIELRGFLDASYLAMATTIYARVVTDSKEVRVNLVCAKTKVAPLKRLMIPRLELTSALMLSRLMVKTQRTLELSECPIFLWTDFAVTFTWIFSHSSRWKNFIRNQTTVI